MTRSITLGVLASAAALLTAQPSHSLEQPDHQQAEHLDLIGQVTGIGRTPVRVTVFSIDHPFTSSTETDLFGEFRFHALAPGNYTLSILKSGLGATRRTVVVTPGLADDKGVVRVAIAYDPSQAAGVSGGTISAAALAVPERARNKYRDSQKQLSKHDVDGARRSLNEAVQIAPRFTQAWNELGMIAYQLHDLDGAERYFRTALDGEPAAFEPAANLAGVLLSQGRFADSLEINQKALNARPNDALANVQAGIAYFGLGDYEHAEPALLQTIRVDPSHFSKPQLFLADIYLKRGDGPLALAALKDYVARHPDSADAARQRQRIAKLEELLAP